MLIKKFISETGWEWLIEFCQRLVTGPNKPLKAGDVVHHYIYVVGVIYGPLLGCLANDINSVEIDDFSPILLRRCSHAVAVATQTFQACQFQPCHCNDIFCDVNQMYCKLISATYYFCTQYSVVTGKRYSLAKVSLLSTPFALELIRLILLLKVLPHRYIRRAITDFMITNYDNNGVEESYTMKPGVNLTSNMGYLPGSNDHTGKSQNIQAES